MHVIREPTSREALERRKINERPPSTNRALFCGAVKIVSRSKKEKKEEALTRATVAAITFGSLVSCDSGRSDVVVLIMSLSKNKKADTPKNSRRR